MKRTQNRWWMYIILSILLLVVITPFLWMMLGSVKTQGELLQSPPTLWPEAPTLNNFVSACSALNL